MRQKILEPYPLPQLSPCSDLLLNILSIQQSGDEGLYSRQGCVGNFVEVVAPRIYEKDYINSDSLGFVL